MNDCKASGNELFHRLLTASAFLGDHLRNSSPCAIEPLSVRLSCNVGVLWPNGWMDQGATLYGGRPQLRPHYVRWGLGIQLPPKGAQHPPPIFGPYLLWPNVWMDEDATWYGGKPRPRRHCAKCRPSFPHRWHSSPHFSAHVDCGQTAGWIRIPLGTELGLGTGDIALDGDPAPAHRKGYSSPLPRLFGPCLLWLGLPWVPA